MGALALVLAALGCSSGDTTTNDDNLIGGQPTSDAYQAVGALMQDGKAFCTATLVAKRYVVLAQHCIEDGGDEDAHDRDPTKVTFWFGPEVPHEASGKAQLKRFLRPEPFTTPEEPISFYSSDVMLAELTEDVDFVAPIPFDPTPIAVGEPLEAVGYGVTSPDGFGDPSGKRLVGKFKAEATSGNAFEKRYGSRDAFDRALAKVDGADGAAEDGDRIWDQGRLNPDYEVMAHSEQAETCYSDSGGPLLRGTGAARRVVGVVSRGYPGAGSSCLHLGTVFATFGPKTAAFLSASVH